MKLRLPASAGRMGDWIRRELGRRSFDVTDFPDPLPCLWSKGLCRVCDFPPGDEYWLQTTERATDEGRFVAGMAGGGGLIWVRLGTHSRFGAEVDLDAFAMRVLPQLRRPFVLVTTDGDASVPSELRRDTVGALLASPLLRAWYTQNHDGGASDRICPIPIGLDLHTPRPFSSPRRLLGELGRIRDRRADAVSQQIRMVCDLGLGLRSVDRSLAVLQLARLPHVDHVANRLSQSAIWKRYAASPFVLSARGNGLDAHRTWEALYLGSIVITRRSSLAPLFEGLPVVQVDDWREAADLGNLQGWQRQFGPLTTRDNVWGRLDPRRWAERMRAELGRTEGTGAGSRA